jgi:predicted PurR-regulated permease PerM
MSFSVRQQLFFWGILLIVSIILLSLIGNILLPFIAGTALAYLLDPLADRLQHIGFNRLWAVICISFIFILIFAPLAVFLFANLVDQLTKLISAAPAISEKLTKALNEILPSKLSETFELDQSNLPIGEFLKSTILIILSSLVKSFSSLLSIVGLMLITPIITIYLLLDWDRLVAKVDRLLPLDHAKTIRNLSKEINDVIAGFIRGMGSVCCILGIYYAVALMFLGLEFGLVIGVFAGFLTFIPYLGAILGGIMAIGLSTVQFWGDWNPILLVIGIFVLGQLIEGNFLTPKLVGNSVGLHPVSLMLALSIFGSIFGLIGMMIAVPIAASMGVLVRFLINQYLNSPVYVGKSKK